MPVVSRFISHIFVVTSQIQVLVEFREADLRTVSFLQNNALNTPQIRRYARGDWCTVQMEAISNKRCIGIAKNLINATEFNQLNALFLLTCKCD